MEQVITDYVLVGTAQVFTISLIMGFFLAFLAILFAIIFKPSRKGGAYTVPRK